MVCHRFFSLLFCLFGASLEARSLFPEDASHVVKAWYFSSENRHYKNKTVWTQLEMISKKHNFELINIGPSYEWSQDSLLFDEQGSFLITPPIEDSSFLDGISLGISRSWEEDPDRIPFRITQEFPFRFHSYRQLNLAFVEGGNLISGRFVNGEPYVIVEERVVSRAQKYIKAMKGIVISYKEAREAIAEELGVQPSRLYEIRSNKHLDLLMMPLPGGIILLHDPNKVPFVLESVAKLNSSPIDPYSFANDQLNAIENQLSDDFKIVRVAGAFEDLQINFFNGFQGRDEKGNYWQVTNSAKGLKNLEEYWEATVKAHLPNENVSLYFPGIYSYGAGIDCSGAVGL